MLSIAGENLDSFTPRSPSNSFLPPLPLLPPSRLFLFFPFSLILILLLVCFCVVFFENKSSKMAAAIKETISNLVGMGGSHEEPALREPSAEEFQKLQQKYTEAGQDQVFAFVDELSPADKTKLFHQLTNFEPTRINELAEKALNPPAETEEQKSAPSLEPLPDTALASILDSDAKDIQKWYDAGLQAVAENKVGVVLMAGGQGTRLGSSDPKGCFNIGLPSQKTLFQIQAERIARLQVLAKKSSGKDATIPWYIMTSGPTRKPTEEFFKKHSYFGLDNSNVVIFEQGILPCISNEGKILMESKSKVWVLAPCPWLY